MQSIHTLTFILTSDGFEQIEELLAAPLPFNLGELAKDTLSFQFSWFPYTFIARNPFCKSEKGLCVMVVPTTTTVYFPTVYLLALLPLPWPGTNALAGRSLWSAQKLILHLFPSGNSSLVDTMGMDPAEI